MNKLKNVVLTTILLMACCQVVLIAETSTSIEPQDALVLVIMRSYMGRRAGNGFVIGDGTLVVTAHHLVFEKSERGGHEMSGLVFVASPYLGDGSEARIVAADEELDLAVLEIPWKGHPALKLAEESGLLSAERLAVTGIPETIRSIGPSAHEPLLESLDVQIEDLAVNFIAVRRQIPRFISLSGIGQLGDGWSGSPMLLPDTSIAAGCFTALHSEGGEPVGSRGPAVTQIKRLLKQSDREQSLMPSDLSLSRREDGMDAFILLAQAYHHFVNDQYGWSSDRIEKFISLRPESSFGYTQSATIAEKQGRFDLAEQHHQKALELNPEGMGSRFYYAQFLSSRHPDKALEIFQGMWHVDELKPAVALLMFNILAERNQFQRAGELLNEALKHNPGNAYLWMNLGGCQYKSDKLDEAIASYTKAVELLPERGPFRGQLAHLLKQAGRIDEAEKHFRELLKIEPNNPVVHLWLANFLAKYRPEAKDEALKEAQAALNLPHRRGLPKQEIEKIIQEIQSQTSPAP
ncbi:MAG: tetratricopeptide repeat-containing serine protease family protein [Sedimentisphaerales bacterium]